MKRMKKTISLLLALALCLGLLPVLSMTALADTQDTTYYVNAAGEEQTSVTEFTAVDSTTVTWTTGWYVVNADTSIVSRITVTGDVNLILCDDKTLTATQGITVASGNSLTIWAQNNGKGKLYAGTTDGSTASLGWDSAGIGGDASNKETGAITVNGGTIYAVGNYGAGIGGGYYGSAGTIKINGGEIHATGGYWAAGVGSGPFTSGSAGSVEISGGKVYATGGTSGAGIGAGSNGKIGFITISGAATVIEAQPKISMWGGGQYAAGIGGGEAGAVGTITITGGSITAKGSNGGPGIGAGGKGICDTITITGGSILSSSNTASSGGEAGPGIGCGFNATVNQVVIGGSATVKAVAGYSGYLENGSIIPAIGPGVRGTFGALTLYDTARVWAGTDEDVKTAILAWPDGRADACKENVYAEIKPCDHEACTEIWITAEKHYNVRCQYCLSDKDEEAHNFQGNDTLSACSVCHAVKVAYANDDGTAAADSPKVCLQVTGNMSDVNGLGGWYAVAADTQLDTRIEVTGDVNLILCDGATLTAPKGIQVPEGASLTIWSQSGGTGALSAGVNGSGGCDANCAGIGGGSGDGGSITINGGSITAYGGMHAAGIGGGNNGAGGNITVNGGTVTATSEEGAGIGGGHGGNGGNITINGGNVHASSGTSGAGIGGGQNADGGVIKITGGIIEAISSYGAGIGGGFRNTAGGDFTSITINGGNVTATSNGGGSGIGGGRVNKSDQNPYTPTGTVTLDWEVDDQAIVPQLPSVTANSYNCTVVLARGFKDTTSGTLFAPTDDATIADLAGKTLVPEEVYAITVERGIQNGTVTSDKAAARPKDTVTLTVTPSAGNALDTMTAKHGSDEIETTKVSDTTYTFTMPAGNVTVTATYKNKPSSGSTYAPSITIPVTGENAVQIKATVKGNTATVAALTDKQISSVVAGDDPVGVLFDLSSLGEKIKNVTIPTDTLKKLSEALTDHEGEDTATIKTAIGEVTFDETALQSIADGATGKDVTIGFAFTPKENLNAAQLAALEGKDVMTSVDLSVVISGEPMTTFGGGQATISVPLTPAEGKDGRLYQVYYISEDGTLEHMATSFLNNMIRFLTGHNSNYVLVYEEWPFVDVTEEDACYDAVLWAYFHEPQITNGQDETHFAPDSTVKRGEAVTFLWRAKGKPEPTSAETTFEDLTDDYYTDAVAWAVENGITKGTDTTHFSPEDTLTTAHLITFLYRTLNPNADGWYEEAAAWAKEQGYLDGIGLAIDNQNPCPRGAVVQILYNVLEKA